MKTTVKIKLSPSQEQHNSLLKTVETFNIACNEIAKIAFKEKSASKFSIQKLVYHDIKERYGLSAQLVIRAISKVCEIYKRDKSIQPSFRPHGAIIYDQRIMRFKGLEVVSLWTLDGRKDIPVVIRDYFKGRMDRVQGQADLILIDGVFYLFCTCETPEDTPITPDEFLGVDMGVNKIATDSLRNQYSGEKLEQVRQRYFNLRKNLQSKGTKSAKRHLKKISGKEKRFRKDQNHVISKCIVQTAKDTNMGIAIEDLKGIRQRATVRKSERSKHHGWSFYQLSSCIEYKAQIAGIPVVKIDPKYTSQECAECGHTEPSNRKNQSEFVCKSCGHADNADMNAAKNISIRATSTSLLQSVA